MGCSSPWRDSSGFPALIQCPRPPALLFAPFCPSLAANHRLRHSQERFQAIFLPYSFVWFLQPNAPALSLPLSHYNHNFLWQPYLHIHRRIYSTGVSTSIPTISSKGGVKIVILCQAISESNAKPSKKGLRTLKIIYATTANPICISTPWQTEQDKTVSRISIFLTASLHVYRPSTEGLSRAVCTGANHLMLYDDRILTL